MDWLKTEQGKGHIEATKSYINKAARASKALSEAEQAFQKLKNHMLKQNGANFDNDIKNLRALLKKSRIQV